MKLIPTTQARLLSSLAGLGLALALVSGPASAHEAAETRYPYASLQASTLR